jgi:antitoxin HicB
VRDLDPGEVARELGLSQRHVSRATQAALAKLRSGLEAEGEEGVAAPVPDAPVPGRGASNRLPRGPAEPKMASMSVAQRVEQGYLERPYHIELVRSERADGGWTAQVEELPGCEARGGTPDEALRHIEGAMQEWIADAVANRREVPEPRSASSHSGRLLLRMPQSLHAELARAADREEVSLNQFITGSLASAIGWRRGAEPAAKVGAEPDGAARSLRLALLANVVVLAVVGIVALVLLVVAL